MNNMENSFTFSAMALYPLSIPVGFRKLNYWFQASSKELAMAIWKIFITFHFSLCLSLELEINPFWKDSEGEPGSKALLQEIK